MDALSKMDVAGREVFKTENNGDLGCLVRVVLTPSLKLVRTDEAVSDPCSLPTDVTHPQSCTYTTFHGYNGAIIAHDHPDNTFFDYNTWEYVWIMPKGGHYYILSVFSMYEEKGPDWAEALWSVAEDRLPLSEVPVNSTEQPVQTVVPVTTVPNEVTGGDVPTVPVAPTDKGELFGIPPAVILGSLGIPVAGAVAGAALSSILSLVSGGMAAGNPIKPVSPPQVQPVPPQTSLAPISADPSPVEIADLPPVENASPPPVEIPDRLEIPYKDDISSLKIVYKFVKNAAKVFDQTSVYNTFLSGPDTEETVNLIRTAAQTYNEAPSLQSATNFLDSLRESNALRQPWISKSLGVAFKGVDVIQAGMNARNICVERAIAAGTHY